MPRVINESGSDRLEQLRLGDRPPAGLKAQCHSCKADLETTNYETVWRERVILGQKKARGWTIFCPRCGSPTFFPQN